MNPIGQLDIRVTPGMEDTNGHVNNVAYIQWMQDAAVLHARDNGCTAIATALGGTWVVRSHHVTYLSPAHAGEVITVQTWIADVHRVHSMRKYKLIRASDQTVVVRAETDWVFVDMKTGRPRAIPDAIKSALPVLPPEQEP